MSVRVRCTKCQSAFLASEPAGSVVACPKCGAQLRLPAGEKPSPTLPRAVPVRDDDPDEATSVFQPSPEARERKSSRRKLWAAVLGLLLVAGVSAFLVLWPRFQEKTNDPVEGVAQAYLQALVDHDAESQKRLGVVEDPPAISGYFDASRDKSKSRTIRGPFAPIAALHRKIDGEFAYDASAGRFTPRNPLGAAGETLDALHEAKADARKSGVYEKMASGDPNDLFDAAEGLGKVFEQLAEGALAPKKILPTYEMLVEDAKPPLPAEPKKLALDVGESPPTWEALLKRPFFSLKADGPFIYDRAVVIARATDELGSPGDPPVPLRLTLVRFQLEGIDTTWRVVEARRMLPESAPTPEPIDHEPSPSAPIPRSPGENLPGVAPAP